VTLDHHSFKAEREYRAKRRFRGEAAIRGVILMRVVRPASLTTATFGTGDFDALEGIGALGTGQQAGCGMCHGIDLSAVNGR